MLTHDQALDRLRAAADSAPSRAWFASSHGFSACWLSRVLSQDKPLSPRLAAAVGLKPLENGFRGVPRHRQPKRFYVEVGQ